MSTGIESTDGRGVYRGTARLPDGTAARVQAVRRTVDQLAPDVVHAHSSWAGLYTRVRRLPVPVVYQPHCYYFERPNLVGPVRRSVRLLERALAANGSVVAAVSPREELLARSMGVRDVVRIPNAPSSAAVREAGARSGTPAGSHRTVTMVGRVVAQKDPRFFAETARVAQQLGLGLSFRWLGDGDQTLVRELRDAGVEVTGWLTADDVMRQMAASDVYLHCASYEGFPISVLDAARVGLPTIVREIPAFEGARLTAVGSPAEAAVAAHAAVVDPGRRLRMIESGDRLVGEMDESALHDGVVTAYAMATGGALVS
ncbi:glycosyltransferase involved in cell wall biosynthesis [Promicromonospora iranensis]|uniref:D-inositol 3-phosphate glycosyltransferase n=1 Tax=Promicromonospora iranensis TaxID=1105144 RepID=A0ABU2CR47_9MICO|nr:glycosyltransferase [Promicromonospora iranensis]MDR7383817.1 glycosyltransferase involved in cell wall biosynthesis [Promicromonospora iranensis]